MNYKILALGISIFFGCGTNNENGKGNTEIASASPAVSSGQVLNDVNSFNYDLDHPKHTWKLPEQLVEVSGNTWVDKDHLILIEDLNPLLYLVYINGDELTLEKTISFKKDKDEKFDIEDVSIVGDVVYALWSHGTVFKISNWQNNPEVRKIKTFLEKDNNAEGLCYDPVTKKLLVACKDESGLSDEKNSTRAVYAFDMQSQELSKDPFLLIHKKDFEKIADEKLEFNPSAIAVHPVTHDIYLLTTKDNKGMAVYSHDGKLKTYQEIDKDMMPQPEGICFSPEGVLFISSEGKKGDPGNLFEFAPVGK